MDALSLGITARDLNQPSISSRRLHRTYRFGLGFRPLSGPAGDRLTLFTDLEGEENQRWPREARLIAGLRAEVLPGIFLSGSAGGCFDELDETQEFRVGLGVQFLRSRVEGATAWSSESDGATVTSVGFHASADRPRTLSSKPVLAKVRVRGRLADESRRGLRLPVPIPLLGSRGQTSVKPVLTQLKNARRDPNVRGVLLKIEPVSGTSLLGEIRDEIRKIRDVGKPVVAYLEEAGSHNGYGLAASCDRIVLAPRGALYLLGLRSDILYQGEMLDSLGINVERITSGRFKTSYERYERSSASAGFREQIESIFDDRWGAWIQRVAEARGIDPDSLRVLADGRVLRGPDAVSSGLVDTLGTLDTARDLLADLIASGRSKPQLAYVGRWRYRRYHWGPKPVVAVYYLNGFVNVGRSSRPLFGEKVLGAETVERDLEWLAVDPSVKAVVLRVESGGGLGLGGTLIREAILDFKTSDKPIVVSMGRVAASAAYHFSAAADHIVAHPGTVTGSIGVIVVRPDYAGLLDRIRVHPETIQRGERMGLWSFTRPLDDQEREMAREWIMADYEDFLMDVAEDRSMERDQVHEVAQGRVWTGRQALSRGLVDELGGLEEAVERSRRLAGLGEDIEIREIRRPGKSLLTQLWGSLGVTSLLELMPVSLSSEASSTWEETSPSTLWDTGLPLLPIPHETVGTILPLEYSPLGNLLEGY
jgi:protease-4